MFYNSWSFVIKQALITRQASSSWSHCMGLLSGGGGEGGGVWARSIKTLGAILHWCGLFARGVAALGLGYGGGAGASRGGLGKGSLGMEQGAPGFPDPELAVGFSVHPAVPEALGWLLASLWGGHSFLVGDLGCGLLAGAFCDALLGLQMSHPCPSTVLVEPVALL